MDGGRTVQVCGLPTDVEEEKLIDKLLIHFLRKKNGGGEVAAVSVSKAHAGRALVTFEESQVAQSIVQREKHVFMVDDRKYEVTVSLSHDQADPDEVFVCTQLTVAYSLLPGGKATLSSMQQSFPDVQFTFSPREELCTLKGRFSEVQGLVTRLLASLEPKLPGTHVKVLKPCSTNKKSLNMEVDATSSSKWQEKTRSSGTSPALQAECWGKKDGSHASDLGLRDYSGWKARPSAPGDAPQLEDYSLALDSDIFRYLQQHRREEYRGILSRHSVEVVDVTAQDVTTLYLNAREGTVGGAGGGVDHMQQVHRELAQLYQESEAQLRKELLSKEYVPRSGLASALEHLQQRLPRLMLSEDDSHIYLVGSSSDVSEAKQFLLDLKGAEGLQDVSVGHADVEAQHLRDTLFSTCTSPSLPRVTDRDMTLPKSCTTTGLDAEWANFREDIENVGEDRPKPLLVDTQFTLPTIRQKTNSVRGGQRPSSGLAIALGGIAAGPGRGHDIFKRASSTESSAFRAFGPASTVLPSKNKHFASTQGSLVNEAAVDGGPASTATSSSRMGSQTARRRSNSFSGVVRPKSVETAKDDMHTLAEKTKQSASNAVSTSFGKRDIYRVEMLVPAATWIYMKDIWSSRLDEIKSSLDTKEILSGNTIILQLSGPDPDKLSTFQEEVIKLESLVYIKELPLLKLGMEEDPKDKTLEEFCEELRGRFHKVKIMLISKKIFILGPKTLCEEVFLCLRKAFPHTIAKEKGGEEGHSHPKETYEAVDFRKNQVATPRSYTEANGGLDGSMGAADGAQSEETERESKQTCSSKRKAGAKKSGSPELSSGSAEERGNGSAVKKGVRCNTALTKPHALSWSATPLGGPTSLPTFAYETKNFVWPKERDFEAGGHDKHCSAAPKSHDAQGELDRKRGDCGTPCRMAESETKSMTCGCGVSGSSVTRTLCGVTVCPECRLQAHSSCRVCHQEDERRGMRGTISCTEMSFSLPGHPKDLTLKIAYTIPDGIQGKQDPNPGAPFQGGEFQAFLPSSERARKLLPLLKEAFTRGHTFIITRGKVAWGSIPHKSCTDGSISRSGYPDSNYLSRLEYALRSMGLEGEGATAGPQASAKTDCFLTDTSDIFLP